MKWIRIKCKIDARGSISEKGGTEFNVNEKNKYFDWYKDSSFYIIKKEWETK